MNLAKCKICGKFHRFINKQGRCMQCDKEHDDILIAIQTRLGKAINNLADK